jgi:hypothetical protein
MSETETSLSEPCRVALNPARNAFSAARNTCRSARAERERRVVEGLTCGVAMAEIARREGITVRGLRKYVGNLIERRAPEASGEFIAVQLNRLNEALRVSFDAMSAENLPAIDRVVKIVREFDRYHGLGGGAKGTEQRRKLLESLVSGAGMEASPVSEDDSSDPLADIDLDALLSGVRSPGPSARGTGMRRNPLESLDSGAETAPNRPCLAGEARGDEAAEADPNLIAELDALLGALAQQGRGPGERGTQAVRNPLKTLDSGAVQVASLFAENRSGAEGTQGAFAGRTRDPKEVIADLPLPSSGQGEPGTERRLKLLKSLDSGASMARVAPPLSRSTRRAPSRTGRYSDTFALAANSPTSPRRKASTQATKTTPWMTVTHSPN